VTTRSISVVYPVQPSDPAEFREFGRWVAEHPGSRLWTGQSQGISSFQAAAYLAGGGIHVPFGLGVNLLTLMHPSEFAVQARSMAMLTGYDVLAGVGTGGPAFVRAMTGADEERPAARTREYLDVARATIGGVPFDYEGRYYSVRAGYPAVSAPQVGFGAGVLRPTMARVAGASADFVVVWLTPAAWVADTLLPALDQGALGAGRSRPRVVSYLHAAVDRVGRDPRSLVAHGNSAHLAAAHYVDMLRSAGLPIESDGTVSPGSLIDHGVFGFGSPTDIARMVHSQWDAGIDEVALNLSGVYLTEGMAATLRDLDAILDEL